MTAQTHTYRTDLPLYRSHKLVRAAKITGVRPASGVSNHILELTTPEGPNCVIVSSEWLNKRVPAAAGTSVHGYYVVYADGYDSWSPREQFEQGNTLLTAADIAQLAQPHLDGKHPEGRANVNDEGAVAVAVSLADAPTGCMVRIDFGKPTAWIGLPPQQAAQLASALMKYAREGGAVITLEL